MGTGPSVCHLGSREPQGLLGPELSQGCNCRLAENFWVQLENLAIPAGAGGWSTWDGCCRLSLECECGPGSDLLQNLLWECVHRPISRWCFLLSPHSPEWKVILGPVYNGGRVMAGIGQGLHSGLLTQGLSSPSTSGRTDRCPSPVSAR